MLCPDCNVETDGIGRKGFCDICNRRIIKRSKGRMTMYRFFDMLKLHRHNYVVIETIVLKNRHGTFNIGLMKCSKCRSREWILSGLIEQVEAWERDKNIE